MKSGRPFPTAEVEVYLDGGEIVACEADNGNPDSLHRFSIIQAVLEACEDTGPENCGGHWPLAAKTDDLKRLRKLLIALKWGGEIVRIRIEEIERLLPVAEVPR